MIVTTLILVLILIVLTGWVTHHVKDREIKAAWVAPLWGGGAILVIVAFAGVYYVNALRVYDRCVFTAERSIGSRAQTLQLYDTIDIATSSDRFTQEPLIVGQPSLRMSLDENLPVLNPADCDKP